MKKLFAVASLIVLATSLALTPGCQTVTTTDAAGNPVTTTQLDPQRTAAAIHAIVPPAVTLAIAKEPKTVVYFQTASLVLHTALNDGVFDPAKLDALLKNAGADVSELQTPEAKAALQAAIGVYQAYFGDVVAGKLDQLTWLKPVLTAVVDSIDTSLPRP